jgi:predicted dehydrogenase
VSIDAYVLDRANGASLLSVWGGHTIDTVTTVLGPLADVAAQITTGRDTVTIAETGEARNLGTPDNVMLHGRLMGGASLSIHLRGGPPVGVPLAATGFRFEIVGTDGTLIVTAEGSFGMVLSDLRLMGSAGKKGSLITIPLPLDVSTAVASPLPPYAEAFAETYKLVARDLINGTESAANIDTGTALHHVLGIVDRAAASGVRTPVG